VLEVDDDGAGGGQPRGERREGRSRNDDPGREWDPIAASRLLIARMWRRRPTRRSPSIAIQVLAVVDVDARRKDLGHVEATAASFGRGGPHELHLAAEAEVRQDDRDPGHRPALRATIRRLGARPPATASIATARPQDSSQPRYSEAPR